MKGFIGAHWESLKCLEGVVVVGCSVENRRRNRNRRKESDPDDVFLEK